MDATVLARHFQLGQRPERAAHFHTRAAEQFFARDDQQGVMRSVEAALACGVGGEALTRLRALQAVVAVWMEQLPRALKLGTPVLRELKAGSRLWCWLVDGLILANAVSGHQEEAARLSTLVLNTSPEPAALAVYVEALSHLGNTLLWSGERQFADTILERIMRVGAQVMDQDGLVRGQMRLLKASSSAPSRPGPGRPATSSPRACTTSSSWARSATPTRCRSPRGCT